MKVYAKSEPFPCPLCGSSPKIAAHLDYLVRELDSMAADPPHTSDAMTEYLRGLEAYVQQIRDLLPNEEEGLESFELEVAA
jgi:hypothetical protein